MSQLPSAFFFYLLAALTLGSAAGVAFARNILYSGFALLGTLTGVAGLYLYLAADFLGVAQLLIYVGGILVLILFAVLLTNRIGDIKISNRSTGLVFGVPPIAGLVVLLVRMALATPWPTTEAVPAPTTARLGDAFLREFLMPFEVISLVLLMALVGAMVIGRPAAQRKKERR